MMEATEHWWNRLDERDRVAVLSLLGDHELEELQAYPRQGWAELPSGLRSRLDRYRTRAGGR